MSRNFVFMRVIVIFAIIPFAEIISFMMFCKSMDMTTILYYCGRVLLLTVKNERLFNF